MEGKTDEQTGIRLDERARELAVLLAKYRQLRGVPIDGNLDSYIRWLISKDVEAFLAEVQERRRR